ncbi:S1 family peptidase [Streptomyces sp. NPDC026206]|uniref:S1 family peptidase n=1 Tax=Streptomyces sp. NPDC026206 TaxID=3157089 RepID=UPI0033F6950C
MQRPVRLRRAATLAAAAFALLASVTLTPHTADASAEGAPRAVRSPDPRLTAAQATLDKSEAIPGTAWVADPGVNRIVVTADRTVTGAQLGKLNAILKPLGELVELKRISTEIRPLIAGGDAIWDVGGTARCSLGFNVKRAGKPDAFLTAGHCGNIVASWAETQGGAQIAKTSASTFPGKDYSIAEYTSAAAHASAVTHPSAVNLYDGTLRPVTGPGDASVGEAVQRSGSTTQLHGGQVTGLNATVTYKEGRITGLIKTNVCAEPGDSGGPLFDGGLALGLLSGGSGDCALGGETYYQPVKEVLTAYGATLG